MCAYIKLYFNTKFRSSIYSRDEINIIIIILLYFNNQQIVQNISHFKSALDSNCNNCMTNWTKLSFSLASATTFIIYHHFLGIIMLRVRRLLCYTYNTNCQTNIHEKGTCSLMIFTL